ncbi:MAG: hypothetical protein CMQ61_02470 [Gammaproteobacteria bacterium]|nr:hypothetical protein [Gammaproteobacteria bacterium]
MRDGIELARRQRPAVALVTETFWDQGNFISKAAGMPDIPRVALPHPVAGTGEARMSEIADGIADEIRTRLSA